MIKWLAVMIFSGAFGGAIGAMIMVLVNHACGF